MLRREGLGLELAVSLFAIAVQAGGLVVEDLEDGVGIVFCSLSLDDRRERAVGDLVDYRELVLVAMALENGEDIF